jgi:hypothetical protein
MPPAPVPDDRNSWGAVTESQIGPSHSPDSVRLQAVNLSGVGLDDNIESLYPVWSLVDWPYLATSVGPLYLPVSGVTARSA